MNWSFANGFLVLSAVALAAINVKVWRNTLAGAELPGNSSVPVFESNRSVVQASARPAAEAEQPADSRNESTTAEGKSVRTSPPAQVVPAVDWSKVETWDYKQYVKNLRAMGFPE